MEERKKRVRVLPCTQREIALDVKSILLMEIEPFNCCGWDSVMEDSIKAFDNGFWTNMILEGDFLGRACWRDFYVHFSCTGLVVLREGV